MRQLLTVITTGLFLFTTAAISNLAIAEDRIPVATLDGETIWLDEILAIAETLPPEYQQAGLPNLYDQLIDEVANARLAASAGRTAGLADDARITEAMQAAANRVLGDVYVTRAVEAEITDEAIANAYEIFAADTGSREQVTASHILLETEEAAKDVIMQLNDGADFAALAKELSTGPSGPNGGALGAFGRGQMVPAFEAAAFDMPDDSYSANPVQTQFGWHVIKVDGKSIMPAPTLDEMRPQLVQNLQRQVFARIVETLRSDATIEARPFEEVVADAQAQQDAAQSDQ